MSHDVVLLIMILPDNKGLLRSWCETNVSYYSDSYLQNVFIRRNTNKYLLMTNYEYLYFVISRYW